MRLCVWTALLYRKIRFGYTFRKIKLTQGKYAFVEVEDFEELNKYKWYARKSRTNCYACRSIKLPDGRRKTISMHRQIINPPEGFLVDHKNRISLDNRRSNLRPATPAQNSYNRGKSSRKSTSKYKGASLNKRTGRWRSAIGFEGRTILLGSFTSEKQAALVYDFAAKKYHREFAYLNFNEKESRSFAVIFKTSVVSVNSVAKFLRALVPLWQNKIIKANAEVLTNKQIAMKHIVNWQRKKAILSGFAKGYAPTGRSLG